MKPKIIDYAERECSDCGKKSNSSYDNICPVCGNWINISLNLDDLQTDWEEFIVGLEKNKLILSDLLKQLFPPLIFNFIVYNSLDFLLSFGEKRINDALIEIKNLPNTRLDKSNQVKLQNQLMELLKYLNIKNEQLQKSHLALRKMKDSAQNPFIYLILKYSVVWEKWNSLKKKQLPIPDDLIAELKEILIKIEQTELIIEKGYPELQKKLIEVIETLKSHPGDEIVGKDLLEKRIILEYQTILSWINNIKHISSKSLNDPTSNPTKEVYQIQFLTKNKW